MFRETRYTSGVKCDGTKCTASVEGDEMSYFNGADHYQKLAVDQGWTFWVGRINRQYCPCCAPKPGHKMRLVDGTPRTEQTT